MPYTISNTAQLASGAAVMLLSALLLVRHILLPRLSDSEVRRFEAPLLILFGVFVLYLVANFLEALP